MNYNKLTSLVANVEAIETAVNIHVQGRTATADKYATFKERIIKSLNPKTRKYPD